MRPAPDSAVAENLRRGRSPWVDAIHLLWTLWVFLTPLFGGGYTWRWAALTLLTYPVFLVLYAAVLLAPRCHAPRYALSMVVLGLVPLAWYPSAVSYFIFGCVTLRVSRRSGYGRYLLQLVGLNALFVVVGLLAHYPWQALIWIPSMAMIISLVVNSKPRAMNRMQRCSCPRMKCAGWRRLPNASASAAICTICWGIRCP